MNKKIVIAGGTGFIGSYLADHYRAAGDEVVIISRQKGHVQWQDPEAITHALENTDMLINLAGRSVDCRYNRKNKAAILSSRVDTTRALGNAILNCKEPPALWLNSSTATIYRHAEDRPMTEMSGETGRGFSVEVGKQWEATFFSFALPHTRQVALRIAIVLGNGGALTPLLRLVQSGLGGTQGNGRQMFSWLHQEDLAGIIDFIRQHNHISGVVNCAAPHPVNNRNLMQTLRHVLETPFGLAIPRWLLEAGAILIRTETELVLKSRWVLPQRLTEAGYVFRYPSLEPALENILKQA